MQRLTKPTARPRIRRASGPPPDDATRRRLDIRWGVIGLVVVVAAAIGITVLSTVQTGVRDYSAFLTDAASLRTGDEVRVAGLTVGKVTALELKADRVLMRFTVDDAVFVGDRTTLDVRMLTIVGGHYLAVQPAGEEPLGDTTIPSDRVVLPYSLPRVFQDAVTPLRQIDGDVLRRSFGELAQAVETTPDGFRRMTTAVGTIVGIMDQQNAQVSKMLSVSDEYLTALARNKSVVGTLIARFRILETLVADNQAQVGESLANLATVLSQVAPLARLWTSDGAPAAQVVTDSIDALQQLADKLGALRDALTGVGAKLTALAGPEDRSGQAPPAVCVPVPGRNC
ncbi:MlaD family protein [Nocardia inohanensis]|uniref:MlaD family protein n=1 Tax=Nocardia inohanensis TaxID=209246 RepID=UPI000AB506E3|nr:MlaD family protein [Nocardia inohanensis]